MKKSILVVGGAGYIGSHTAKYLESDGHCVVVFDNLSTGHLDAVPRDRLIVADLSDKQAIDHCFKSYEIETVMYFAGSISVGESVVDPAKYYRNNVINTIHLLDCMHENNVSKIIYSSTAAVYGEPKEIPIPVGHPKNPVSPYGKSKLIVEQIVEDYAYAYNLQYVFLRYFNAAGADPEGALGERHEPETHLIPLALQVASGKKDHLLIHGNDYKTADGTCIRDYVHVCDIANAHVLAMHYLNQTEQSNIFNLGNGVGYSVKQIVETVESITKQKIDVQYVERRAGDPLILIADPKEAFTILNWQPVYPKLEDIIEHAWQWENATASKSTTA